MGYTHTFVQKKKFNAKEWHSFTEFVERLTHYKPTICGPDGTGVPFIDSDEVSFNGNAGTGDDYETFVIHRDIQDVGHSGIAKGFGFCKTDRKPYDTAVVACLVFIHSMNPKLFKMASSGNLSNWHEGLHLCKAVSGLDNLIIPDLDN